MWQGAVALNLNCDGVTVVSTAARSLVAFSEGGSRLAQIAATDRRKAGISGYGREVCTSRVNSGDKAHQCIHHYAHRFYGEPTLCSVSSPN